MIRRLVAGAIVAIALVAIGNPLSSEKGIMIDSVGVVSQVNSDMALAGPTDMYLEGISDRISNPSSVLRAHDNFKNTIGLGTEAWLAEPGVLLVGPGFPQEKVDRANGAIEYFNPLTQVKFTDRDAEYVDVPEGHFGYASFGSSTVRIRNFMVHMPHLGEDHIWRFTVRGLFPDGSTPRDRNSTAEFTNYKPGHGQYMRLPKGAFWSEGQFEQITKFEFESGGRSTNCGYEDCHRISAFFLDLNTGAALLIRRTEGGPWYHVWDNFR